MLNKKIPVIPYYSFVDRSAAGSISYAESCGKMNEQQPLLIYDISPEQVKALLPDQSGYKIIDANASAAFCRGCFGCWLKTPGCCVIKDRLQTIAAQIGCCKEVIILSRCCYGGFSSGVKRVLDRAIAVSLPFFTYRGGRVHHICRYKKHLRCAFAFMVCKAILIGIRRSGWQRQIGSIKDFQQ